mmetsp:Transcript_2799/g.6066  ORF Transcript_2799/g.6066 Transcript_2799/m.6066 type:complete len:355 (+) Transcript_2799:379-1443(+)
MVVSLRNMPLAIFFCLLVLAYSPCWAHPNVQSCFLAGASSSDPLGHSRRAANTMAFDSVATSLGRMQLIPPTRSINLMSKQKQKSNSQNSYSNFNPQFMMAKKSNIPEYFTRNNKNDQDGDANGDSLKTSKKGVFRRVRDRIANTFAGTNNNNDNNKNSESNDETENYKPTILDNLRLQMAKAMSGLSNLNLPLFQRSRQEWVVACPKTRVGPGQITPCVVNGLDIIIFASRDGSRLDAFANSCPHLGSPFDLGTIERKESLDEVGDGAGDGCVDCIVCPVHRTAFEIQSGEVRGEWCPYPPILGGVMGYVKPKSNLVKFAVRLRGKNVEVRIVTPLENVGKGDEGAKGLTNIK